MFPLFIKTTSPSLNRFSELFTHKGDWLHLTCFFFIGAWIIKEMYLNFSNSLGRTFFRDNFWRRSARNDALSKWLKSLYWIILGIYFRWKVFKTVNVSLWKSDKHLTNGNFSGWFVKLWSISVGLSRFLKQVGCLIKFLRLYNILPNNY